MYPARRLCQVVTVGLLLGVPMVLLVKASRAQAPCSCFNECPKWVLCELKATTPCDQFDEAYCGDNSQLFFKLGFFECKGSSTTGLGQNCDYWRVAGEIVFDDCYGVEPCIWVMGKCIGDVDNVTVFKKAQFIVVPCAK